MRNKSNKEKKSKGRIILNVIEVVFLIGVIIVMTLLYGPWDWARNTIISSAMTTMEHQWIAKLVYNDDLIEEVMNNNYVIEVDEDTITTHIMIKEITGNETYENEYEEAILKKDPDNNLYKIIPIEGYVNPAHYYKGYLVAVYDPSKVKIAVTQYLGTRGEYITDIAKSNNAKIAVNASGYEDPDWMGNGGQPTGTVIKDGKIVYGANVGTVNIIGFNKDNILVLSRMTPQQAIAKGIRDAISFSPFLIVNGKASFVKGDGGWGIAPRTAIGQRKDGIVLILVVDGRQAHSIGADMVDLTEIMQRYGAYNAANVDGGSSSTLLENSELITKPTAAGKDGMRWIPNAWIVE